MNSKRSSIFMQSRHSRSVCAHCAPYLLVSPFVRPLWPAPGSRVPRLIASNNALLSASPYRSSTIKKSFTISEAVVFSWITSHIYLYWIFCHPSLLDCSVVCAVRKVCQVTNIATDRSLRSSQLKLAFLANNSIVIFCKLDSNLCDSDEP